MIQPAAEDHNDNEQSGLLSVALGRKEGTDNENYLAKTAFGMRGSALDNKLNQEENKYVVTQTSSAVCANHKCNMDVSLGSIGEEEEEEDPNNRLDAIYNRKGNGNDYDDYDEEYESVKDAAASNRVDSDIRSIISANNKLAEQLQRSIGSNSANNNNKVARSRHTIGSIGSGKQTKPNRLRRPNRSRRISLLGGRDEEEESIGSKVEPASNSANYYESLRALVRKTIDFNTDKKTWT